MQAIVAILALGVVCTMANPAEVYYGKLDLFQDPCPLEPLPVPPGNMNTSFTPTFEIMMGSKHEGMIVGGLPEIEVLTSIVIINLQLLFNASIPRIELEMTNGELIGYVDTRPFTCLPNGNFSGIAHGRADIRNLRVRGNAVLFVNIIGNRVSIRELTIVEFTFERICIDFPDLNVGGPVDWPAWCGTFKARFEAEWANTQLREGLVDRFRVTANVIVGQYTLAELIELINNPTTSPPCIPNP